jgi:hypothetical protein
VAVIYLRSTDGSDASDGLTWANAKATLAAALTAAGAGGTVYVSDNHAETQASAMTLTSPGTAASPVTVICVNDAGDPEPPTQLATTGTVSTTGTNSINFAGFAYVYGITFFAGDVASNAGFFFQSASPWWWTCEQCVFDFTTSSANNPRLFVGINSTASDDSQLELIDSDLNFGNAAQGIVVRCPLVWKGGSILGTAPTVLMIASGAGKTGHAIVRGVDLSAMGSGTSLVDAANGNHQDYIFENCKLGSSVAVTTGSVAGQGGVTVELVNCDSADTNYRYCKKVYQGEITHETTIVRTGGASDGTTPISRKMVSSANSKFYSPLVLEVDQFWNESTSELTVTVEVVTDNVTLTDAEAWLEVEYLGTSGFPISTFISDRASNILSTPANQTTSTETWTTTGLATPVKQKFSVTFTPAEKGVIKARVMLAKASTTMYVCPKVKSDSARQYQAGPSMYVNEGASGGGGTVPIPTSMSGGLLV